MRIQGDGIGLPKGVGDSGKQQTQEKSKDSAEEKTKGQKADESIGKDVASTAPRNEKNQSEQGKSNEAVPEKAKGDDGGAAKGRGRAADGRPATGAPGIEKERDPLARRIDQGLERDPDAARPTNVNVKGTGVEVPRCFDQSREGEKC